MLRISHTGIRSGEIIEASSSGNACRGTVMIIRGFYPPSRKYVNELPEEVIRDLFNSLPFFSPLSSVERKKWLLQHATEDNDLYLEDANLEVKFVSIGGKFFQESLDDATRDELLRGNPADPEGYWLLSDIYHRIPKKNPNSRARKHTLVFRPSNWTLRTSEPEITSFSGLSICLDNSVLQGSCTKPSGGGLRVFSVERLKGLLSAFAIYQSTTRSRPLTWEIYLFLAGTVYPATSELNSFRELISWCSPSLLKSLLQKLIRTRCVEVEYAGVKYPARGALLATFGTLLLHPGAFVPNIQRFVSGTESAFKRSAVTIFEDSYLPEPRFLLGMMAAAAWAQVDKEWAPPDSLITSTLQALLYAQQETRMYDYDWHSRTSDVQGITEWNPLTACYLLLAEVKSFESDIQMVGSIAERGGRSRSYTAVTAPLAVMPLIHCVDHHSQTEIALLLPPPTATPIGTETRKLNSSKEGVFKPVFSMVWSRCVGVNPRDSKYASYNYDDPDVLRIREAQRLLWISSIAEPELASTPSTGTYSLRYTLDASVIAGLIGSLEVKVGTTTAIVVIRVDDISSFTAIRRPSRDNRDPELSEPERVAAISEAQRQLMAGRALRGVPSTLPQLAGATVYLRMDDDGIEYWLQLARSSTGSELVRWSDYRTLSLSFPTYPYPKLGKGPNAALEYAQLHTSDGVAEEADARYTELLDTTAPGVLHRLATYLEGYASTIAMHKISRDGDGVDLAVVPEDVGVYRFLTTLCVLYPAALEMEGSTRFRIKSGPLLWTLRDRVTARLRQPVAINTSWPSLSPDSRPLWEHQKEILERMAARRTAGKRGHEIWATVGSGKTRVVTSFLEQLVRSGRIPLYTVYTLPPSAVQSVLREFATAGIPVLEIDMRAKGKNQVLQPGCVNLVLHDHLRQGNLEEQLKAVSGSLLFVIDEFHKTMASNTQRTSITLSVVRTCTEFVAMTGTLIKSDDPAELIPWLSLLVEFEVTPQNYLVAMSALISKKVSVPVTVERVEMEAPLPSQPYYSLVPKSLGGTADKIDFVGALRECYAAVTTEMVRQAMAYLAAGEKLFLVTKDAAHQTQLQSLLRAQGVQQIFLITGQQSIVLTPADRSSIQVVITTMRQCEGYTLTDRRIAISAPYFSNECTRSQLDGRLVRQGQPSPVVRLVTIHCGILSYIFRGYEKARTLAEAMKGFAEEVGMEVKELKASM